MRRDKTRHSRFPRWPYLVVLLIAAAGLLARFTVLRPVTKARPAPVQVLRGVTRQGSRVELGVQDGSIRWLKTSLSASCGGGGLWEARWSPVEGAPVHFRTTGKTFYTSEQSATSDSRGIVAEAGFAVRGTFTGQDAAQGTLRLLALFYHGTKPWNTCDSLDVSWTAKTVGRTTHA